MTTNYFIRFSYRPCLATTALFVSNAQESGSELPSVTDGRRGKTRVAKNGAKFGLINGMGGRLAAK